MVAEKRLLYKHTLVELQWNAPGLAVRSPFCLNELSEFSPDFGACDFPLEQRLLVRVPFMFRSPVRHSGSFSISDITITLCSGTLWEQEGIPDCRKTSKSQIVASLQKALGHMSANNSRGPVVTGPNMVYPLVIQTSAYMTTEKPLLKMLL